ncbi:MAG: hypothetical protein HXX81_08160 [Campylobacterales bacterium]|nr:hypothetical protein [Campylobacterales bacterium]
MSISQIRTILYGLGKYLGDFQAIFKAIQTRNIRPVITRIARRIYGKLSGRVMGKIK